VFRFEVVADARIGPSHSDLHIDDEKCAHGEVCGLTQR
jgi:hypothetical protein